MFRAASEVAAGITSVVPRKRLRVREAELGGAGQSPPSALLTQGSPKPHLGALGGDAHGD